MKRIGKKANALSAVLLFVTLIMAFCMTACGGQGKDAPSKLQGNESDPTAISQEEQEISAGEKKETGKNSGVSAGTEDSGFYEETGNHILVAYFSATGITKKLAEYAAEVMSADLYEIVPEEPYSDADLNWHDKNSRTSIEMNDDSIKPAINGRVADMGQYDIVFIGYPIWWAISHIFDV